jgi:hypothetical protein
VHEIKRIEIKFQLVDYEEFERPTWRADFGSPVPGTPPAGFGRCKDEALGNLLMRTQAETDGNNPTNWSPYLGFNLVMEEKE